VVYVVRTREEGGDRESGQAYLLRRVAESTGGSSWSSSGPELEAAFRGVLETVNARYVLAYEPTGVRRVGRHRIELSVRRRGVDVHARREYFVPDPNPPPSGGRKP